MLVTSLVCFLVLARLSAGQQALTGWKFWEDNFECQVELIAIKDLNGWEIKLEFSKDVHSLKVGKIRVT